MLRLSLPRSLLSCKVKLLPHNLPQGVRHFRVNPLLTEHYDDEWTYVDNSSEYLRLLKQLEPKDIKPKLAKVEISKSIYDSGDLAVITFETVNSAVNIYSLDLILKLMEAYRSPMVSECKIIMVKSAKPGQFIVDDDIEYLSALSPEAYHAYQDLEHQIFMNFMTDHRNVHMTVDGPCMNGGFGLLHTARRILAYDNPSTRFGFTSFKKGLCPVSVALHRLFSNSYWAIDYCSLAMGRTFSAKEAYRLRLVRDLINTEDYKSTFDKMVLAKQLKEESYKSICTFYGELERDWPLRRMRLTDPPAIKYRFIEKFSCRKSFLSLIPTLCIIPYSIRLLWILWRTQKRILSSQLYLLWYFFWFCRKAFNIDMKRDIPLKAGVKTANRIFNANYSKILRHLERRRASLMHSRPPISVNNPPYKTVGIIGTEDWSSSYLLLSNFLKNSSRAHFSLYETSEEARRKSVASFCSVLHQYEPETFEFSTYNSANVYGSKSELSITNNLPHSFENYCSWVDSAAPLLNSDIILLSQSGKNVNNQTAMLVLNEKYDGKIIGILTAATTVESLTANTSNLQKVVGLNYTLLPYKSELVEVIPSSQTSPETLEMGIQVAQNHDKNYLIVKDSPGFFTTRVVCSGLASVLSMIQKGRRPQEIDSALKRMGFDYGLVSYMDFAGIDNILDTMKYLNSTLDLGAELNLLTHLCDSSAFGVKSKRGIYSYKSENPYQRPSVYPLCSSEFKTYKKHLPYSFYRIPLIHLDVTPILLRIVNEAIKCLEENIVSTPECVDVGSVYGFGFPRTLGGPCQYVDAVSAKVVVRQLRELNANSNSSAYKPCDLLIKMAENNEKFYKDV